MSSIITPSLFEKNAKIINKKGLRRSYNSFITRQQEYYTVKPLGLTNKFVFEATVDKDSYQKLADYLSGRGYKLLGSNNPVFLENVVEDYNNNPEAYAKVSDQIKELEDQIAKIKEENKAYLENTDTGDYTFAFIPYNDEVHTIMDFIEAEKINLTKLAEEDDITIIFKVVGHSTLIKGFIGFNFLDADIQDQEVTVDFASRFSVDVDFNMPATILIAGAYLSGIATNSEDLELLNVQINAENLKFNKE